MDKMLSFRNGAWITVIIPQLDPLFTSTQKLRLAAATATSISKGLPSASAFQKAEVEMYEALLGITGKQHDAPKNKKK